MCRHHTYRAPHFLMHNSCTAGVAVAVVVDVAVVVVVAEVTAAVPVSCSRRSRIRNSR